MSRNGHWGSRGPKNRHPTQELAEKRARALEELDGQRMVVYQCRFHWCAKWHVAHATAPDRPRFADRETALAIELASPDRGGHGGSHGDESDRILGQLAAENYGSYGARCRAIRMRVEAGERRKLQARRFDRRVTE